MSQPSMSNFPHLMGTVHRLMVEIARGFNTAPSLYTYTLFHGLSHRNLSSSFSSNTLINYISTILQAKGQITTSKTLFVWLCLNELDVDRSSMNASDVATGVPSTGSLPLPALGLAFLRNELIAVLLSPSLKNPSCFEELLCLLLDCSKDSSDIWYNAVNDVMMECIRPKPIPVNQNGALIRLQKVFQWSVHFYKQVECKCTHMRMQARKNIERLASQSALLLDLPRCTLDWAEVEKY